MGMQQQRYSQSNLTLVVRLGFSQKAYKGQRCRYFNPMLPNTSHFDPVIIGSNKPCKTCDLLNVQEYTVLNWLEHVLGFNLI